MRSYQKYSLLKNRLGIFILIILAVLIVLIIIGSGNNKTSNSLNESKNVLENSTSNTLLDEATAKVSGVLNAKENEQTKLEEVIEETLSEKSLCEEYTLNEGQSIDLKTHTLIVERIAKSSIKLNFDGDSIFMNEGSEKIINNFRIELDTNKIFYFAPHDEANTVILKLGCKTSGENTNEKYVRERGELICKQVYTECKNSFGLE